MKKLLLLLMMTTPVYLMAQQAPHGMIYGKKPSHIGLTPATNLENFMGKRTRISVSVSGMVLLVTKSKGGWFDVDAGQGKVITAHFKNYNVNIPQNLKNHHIIMEGVAQKQFIADDQQHLAGGDKDHAVKANPKKLITFEVTGLAVE